MKTLDNITLLLYYYHYYYHHPIPLNYDCIMTGMLTMNQISTNPISMRVIKAMRVIKPFEL